MIQKYSNTFNCGPRYVLNSVDVNGVIPDELDECDAQDRCNLSNCKILCREEFETVLAMSRRHA